VAYLSSVARPVHGGGTVFRISRRLYNPSMEFPLNAPLSIESLCLIARTAFIRHEIHGAGTLLQTALRLKRGSNGQPIVAE